MAKIKVDLHDIYNNSKAIDKALEEAFEEAIENRIREVEIIPGKGSGQFQPARQCPAYQWLSEMHRYRQTFCEKHFWPPAWEWRDKAPYFPGRKRLSRQR